jgi:aminomethyltransferase
MLVTNATTRERDWQWINDLRESRGFDCSLEDVSDSTGKLDLQGPSAEDILQTLTNYDLKNLHYYHFVELKVLGKPAIISRSGYTGEDGFEIYAPVTIIGNVWDTLLAAGADTGLRPAGLGARDTLRLEAGLMLNGQDMTEAVSPLEVPYSWTVNWEKDFIGKPALIRAREKGISKKLVGAVMTGRGIARHGYKVLCGSEEIGEVTSGTYSPTLNKAIALTFVNIAYSAPDTEIAIAIRDTSASAKIVKLPFYKREK